ncbi:DUF6879 family protein [Saccharopolyspora rhizosphaerae]|uniref:DUF6879 family protein n=1 Tax=Saccharopolyspora rhizosphaerae TaxID=2492662 RepID=UPI002D76774A|nr:DUF6879 family protein [Saccharopolyspora rhizosphaerae]
MTSDPRPGIDSLWDGLVNFKYSLFRLETLQQYSGSSEDEAIAQWRRTGAIPLTDELRQWCERIDRRVKDGCRAQRVHVVTEPLTDYMRFELASYEPNIQAGEDVRVIPVREGQWPADVPFESDYWLIDARQLFSMRYAPDGQWLGADLVTDPQQIADACAIRDAALAQSLPWRDYNPR